MSDEKRTDMQRAIDEYLRSSAFIVGREATERSDPKAYERVTVEKNFGHPAPDGEDDPFGGQPLEFGSLRFGPRDIAEAKSASEAAGAIMNNMFYATFDEDRVWTNEEWRSAIGKASERYPAFDSILADERTDWRNDDFADRVRAIRDA